jgi:hypothetical protein
VAFINETTLIILTSSFLGIQGVLMLIDELRYHKERGLDTFEKWSHLVDACSVLFVMLFTIFFEPTSSSQLIFFALVALSALLITKDEKIHQRACSAGEQWLHSLLFLIHIPLLLSIGALWLVYPDSWFLPLAAIPVSVWIIYQIIYWNFRYEQPRKHTS